MCLKHFSGSLKFRCRIPVVIMGETGCGKTRLLRFVCSLISQTLEDLDKGCVFNNFRSLKVRFSLLLWSVGSCMYVLDNKLIWTYCNRCMEEQLKTK